MRQPIYHKEANWRVVFRYAAKRLRTKPDFGWIAQQRIAEKGTRDSDCWQDEGPILTKDEAIAYMYQRQPMKG